MPSVHDNVSNTMPPLISGYMTTSEFSEPETSSRRDIRDYLEKYHTDDVYRSLMGAEQHRVLVNGVMNHYTGIYVLSIVSTVKLTPNSIRCTVIL